MFLGEMSRWTNVESRQVVWASALAAASPIAATASASTPAGSGPRGVACGRSGRASRRFGPSIHSMTMTGARPQKPQPYTLGKPFRLLTANRLRYSSKNAETSVRSVSSGMSSGTPAAGPTSGNRLFTANVSPSVLYALRTRALAGSPLAEASTSSVMKRRFACASSPGSTAAAVSNESSSMSRVFWSSTMRCLSVFVLRCRKWFSGKS